MKLHNCHLGNCHFAFSYFLAGLTLDNCYVDDSVDFQAGGYNQPGYPVIITNCTFRGFVNFFDCRYQDDFTASGNAFTGGTNILGKPHNIPITFDRACQIDENTGILDADHEGDVLTR